MTTDDLGSRLRKILMAPLNGNNSIGSKSVAASNHLEGSAGIGDPFSSHQTLILFESKELKPIFVILPSRRVIVTNINKSN